MKDPLVRMKDTHTSQRNLRVLLGETKIWSFPGCPALKSGMVERTLQMSLYFSELISAPAGSRNPKAGLWLHCLRSVQRSCGNVVPVSKSKHNLRGNVRRCMDACKFGCSFMINKGA